MKDILNSTYMTANSKSGQPKAGYRNDLSDGNSSDMQVDPLVKVDPLAVMTSSTDQVGRFAEDGTYIPRKIVENDLKDVNIVEAYASTMVTIVEGQMVNGTVVRIDKEEVLLDIGYKSEGVIPARELSIRHGR